MKDNKSSFAIGLVNLFYGAGFVLINAAYISPEVYGGYVYILAIVGILRISLLPGLDKSLAAIAAADPKQALAANTMSLAGVPFAILAVLLAYKYSDCEKSALIIASISFAPLNFLQRAESLLVGMEQYLILLFITILKCILSICSLIYIAFDSSTTPTGYYGILTSTQLFAFALMYITVIIKARKAQHDTNSQITLKSIGKNSISITFWNLPSYLLEPAIMLKISLVFGNAGLGTFSIANRVFQTLSSLVKSYLIPFSIHIFKRGTYIKKSEIISLLQQGTLITCVTVLFLLLLIFIISKDNVYYYSLIVLTLMSLSLILDPLATVFTKMLAYSDSTIGFNLLANAIIVTRYVSVHLSAYFDSLLGLGLIPAIVCIVSVTFSYCLLKRNYGIKQ